MTLRRRESRLPMEAAAMPLPRPESTPPVTTMYLQLALRGLDTVHTFLTDWDSTIIALMPRPMPGFVLSAGPNGSRARDPFLSRGESSACRFRGRRLPHPMTGGLPKKPVRKYTAPPRRERYVIAYRK